MRRGVSESSSQSFNNERAAPRLSSQAAAAAESNPRTLPQGDDVRSAPADVQYVAAISFQRPAKCRRLPVLMN